MNITVKVAFWRGEAQEGEFKQFSINEDQKNDDDIFTYVSSKSKEVLQGTEENKQYKLQWRDEEGDLVDFSTQEEAQLALNSVKDGTLYVFVKEIPATNDFPAVVCKECQEPVTGARYVCMVCPNYNMCETCEAAGHHIEHDVVKLVKHAIPDVMDFPRDLDGEFVPPPRFRRWMNRFARRWHKRNGYLDDANDTQRDANGHSPIDQGVSRKRSPHGTGDEEWTRREKVLMRLRKKRQRLNEDIGEQMNTVSDESPMAGCSRRCCKGRRGQWRQRLIQNQDGKEETTGTSTDPILIDENTVEEPVCEDNECCRHRERGFGRHGGHDHHGRHHHGKHHHGRRHHGKYHRRGHHHRKMLEEHSQGDGIQVQMPHHKIRKCGRGMRRVDWREYKVQYGKRHAHHTMCQVKEGKEQVLQGGRRCGRRHGLMMANNKTVPEGSDAALAYVNKDEESVTNKLEMMTLGEERSKFQRMNRQQWRCRAPIRRHFRKSPSKPQE